MQVDGNRMKEVVFNEIDLLLSHVLNEKEKAAKSGLDFKLSRVLYYRMRKKMQ